MKLTKVGKIFATRELTLSGRAKVTVAIGKPRKFRGGIDYYCPFQITGMGDEKVRYTGGADAVQALQLALVLIGVQLQSSEEARAGKLSWDGGRRRGDFGFPERP